MILFMFVSLVARAEMTAEQFCKEKSSTYAAYKECLEENQPKSPTGEAFEAVGNAFKARSEYMKNHQIKMSHCVPDGVGGLTCE